LLNVDSLLSKNVQKLSPNDTEYLFVPMFPNDDYELRDFNEITVLNGLEYLSVLLANPPPYWKDSIALFYLDKLNAYEIQSI